MGQVLTNNKNKENIVGYIKTLVLAIILALVIKLYIVSPTLVFGQSMQPSFDTWNLLLVDVFLYKLIKGPERGDVVIVKSPWDNDKLLLKRIVALPNESIEIKNGHIVIYNENCSNGILIDEEYISESNKIDSRYNLAKLKLNNNEYFVLGDNRKNSADSRIFGPIQKNDIVGRALMRLFPFTKLSIFPGKQKALKTHCIEAKMHK